jgi:hypothetical protein
MANIIVSMMTRLRARRFQNQGSIPGVEKNVSFLHNFQTGSGVYAASCPMRTGDFFRGTKAAGT